MYLPESPSIFVLLFLFAFFSMHLTCFLWSDSFFFCLVFSLRVVLVLVSLCFVFCVALVCVGFVVLLLCFVIFACFCSSLGSFGVIFGRLGGRFGPLGGSWGVTLGVFEALEAVLGRVDASRKGTTATAWGLQQRHGDYRNGCCHAGTGTTATTCARACTCAPL